MPLIRKAIFYIALLVASGCSHTVTDYPGAAHSEVQAETRRQMGDLAEHYLTSLQRIEMAAYPLMLANAELCPRRAWSFGFTVGSDFDLPSELRNVAYERLNLSHDAQLRIVAPGTQVWESGMRPGDTLVMFDGKPVRNAAHWRTRLRHYQTGSRPVSFGFMRNGRAHEVQLAPLPMCNYRLLYDWENDEINAYATGKSVVITRGMIDFANDEELMLVIGHELAHNIMHHGRKKEDNIAAMVLTGDFVDSVTGFIGLGQPAESLLRYLEVKKWSPAFEKEADYVGLYLAARAGGHIDDAAGLERRFGVSMGPESIAHSDPVFPYTHPMSAERAAIQTRTIAEIHAKRRKGTDLMPNLRIPWVYGKKHSWWDVDEEDPWIDDDLNH